MSRSILMFTLLLSAFLFQALAPEWIANSSYAQDSEQEEGDSEEEDLTEGLTTLPITPLNFSIIRKGRVRGTVSIVPVLVILKPSDEEIEELRELLPLLRSDMMSVANAISHKRFRVNRPIDPNFVALHFQNRVNQRIGKDRIKIFIQDAIIRPTR